MHPASREELVNLLKRLAEVDGEVSKEEAELVNRVAREMNIDVVIEPHPVTEARTVRLLNIRSALQQYLETSPPSQNVEQLEHLLIQLTDADGSDHADEQSAMEEVRGLIHSYIEDNASMAPFRVLLAPQNEDQISRINTLLSNAPLHTSAGGPGVTAGEFHNREYADAICKEYRNLGFFCVVTDEVVLTS
jgi:uncharacterized tellurite resistance protein B-like protein